MSSHKTTPPKDSQPEGDRDAITGRQFSVGGNRIVVKNSYVWAAVIAAVIVAWIASGQLGRIPSLSASTQFSSQAASETENLPRVRAVVSRAAPRFTEVIIRGRTEASRTVVIRAETMGTVAAVPVREGQTVAEGDILCELSIDAREAQREEAEATVQQRLLEYEAARQLRAKGHRSETQEAGAFAAYNAAKALLTQMEIEIANTKIKAPFGGVVDDRPVEIGDFMDRGDACATIVDDQPFLVVGQVSETEVAQLHVGDKGTARLITGESFEGKLRFISQRADSATRTFRVELEVPNEDKVMREGITTQIRIPIAAVETHKFSPSVLVLNDSGVLGVRVVDDQSIVGFAPVQVVADDTSGIWIAGLPNTVTVITVGQEYVSEGERVSVTIEETGTQEESGARQKIGAKS